MLFLCYPKCSTCQKAKKWLNEHGIEYTERHIAEENPTNAVLHRSYLDRSCIQVCIFDDRIEVLSSGVLYGGLDIITAREENLPVEMKLLRKLFII